MKSWIEEDNINIQKALVEKEKIIPDGIKCLGNYIDELDKLSKYTVVAVNDKIYVEKI